MQYPARKMFHLFLYKFRVAINEQNLVKIEQEQVNKNLIMFCSVTVAIPKIFDVRRSKANNTLFFLSPWNCLTRPYPVWNLKQNLDSSLKYMNLKSTLRPMSLWHHLKRRALYTEVSASTQNGRYTYMTRTLRSNICRETTHSVPVRTKSELSAN